MKKISLVAMVAMMSVACNAQRHDRKALQKDQLAAPVQNTTSPNTPMSLEEQYFSTFGGYTQKVDSIYNSLTYSQRAAQMIMVASSEALGFPYATSVKPAVSKGYAANVLFLKGNKSDFIRQNKELNQYKMAGMDPLYACDCEPTLLHNKFTGQSKMNPTANLQTVADVNKSVDTINDLMDEMGILINFAPIVDVAVNKSVINKRSFGNDPKMISNLASAFVRRTQTDHKAATIKHFPGHGAVIGDTHKQSVSINGSLTELNTFKDVLENSHPLLVMVGHIAVKNNSEGYNTEDGRPATTSRKIITGLLRKKLGFNGIITTDAMNMQASKNFPDADWEAAKAGADLILMPQNAAKLNQKIATEIQNGSELGKQFEASVKRVIRLKMLAAMQH